MKKLVKVFTILTFLGATGIFYGCGGNTSQADVFDTKETKGPVATVMEEVSPSVDIKEKKAEASKKETTSEEIYVYVCGQVKKPGVYSVKPGTRVVGVIEKAGGFTKNASSISVNLAETVTDEEQLYVPSKEEAKASGLKSAAESSKQEANQKAGTKTGKININNASKEELKTLSGIGESKAESIVSYREANGSFASIEDLMKIDGIKQGVFNKIKDNITV